MFLSVAIHTSVRLNVSSIHVSISDPRDHFSLLPAAPYLPFIYSFVHFQSAWVAVSTVLTHTPWETILSDRVQCLCVDPLVLEPVISKVTWVSNFSPHSFY